jgi:hypothetical protein
MKLLLRCGIHLTVSALVPGAAVSDRQDKGLGFAGWAKDRIDVLNGKDLRHREIKEEPEIEEKARHGGRD